MVFLLCLFAVVERAGGTAAELYTGTPPSPLVSPAAYSTTDSIYIYNAVLLFPCVLIFFFRGRKVGLPEGVHGVVLREQPCPDGVRQENEGITSYWATETSFQDVMVRTATKTSHSRLPCYGRPFFRSSVYCSSLSFPSLSLSASSTSRTRGAAALCRT